jgi:hypothetical protein
MPSEWLNIRGNALATFFHVAVGALVSPSSSAASAENSRFLLAA